MEMTSLYFWIVVIGSWLAGFSTAYIFSLKEENNKHDKKEINILDFK